MQQYVRDFLVSRGLLPKPQTIYCEFIGCKHKAVDVHHIKGSYRGERKHAKDGSDLIALCREHHDRATAHANYDTRLHLLALVSKYAKTDNADTSGKMSSEKKENSTQSKCL